MTNPARTTISRNNCILCLYTSKGWQNFVLLTTRLYDHDYSYATSGLVTMYLFLKQIILPPASLLFIVFGGLLTLRRRGDSCWWLTMAVCAVLYLLSTPMTSELLMASLETDPPLSIADAKRGQAIVILSGDSDDSPEYDGADVGPLTLVRLRYGVWLHQRTHLAILVTGGITELHTSNLGEQMARVLEDEFQTQPRWIENRAGTTWENAQYSATLLKADGVQRILLVTHSWHMPRAAEAFRRAGLDVIPAPTAFVGLSPLRPIAALPSAKALLESYYALHELAGALFYRLFHYPRAS